MKEREYATCACRLMEIDEVEYSDMIKSASIIFLVATLSGCASIEAGNAECAYQIPVRKKTVIINVDDGTCFGCEQENSFAICLNDDPANYADQASANIMGLYKSFDELLDDSVKQFIAEFGDITEPRESWLDREYHDRDLYGDMLDYFEKEWRLFDSPAVAQLQSECLANNVDPVLTWISNYGKYLKEDKDMSFDVSELCKKR